MNVFLFGVDFAWAPNLQEVPMAIPFAFKIEFGQDEIAGEQFFAVHRPNPHCAPEVRLMFAVLTDAVQCLEKFHGIPRRRERRLFQDAKTWVLSRNEDSPFAFENVCHMLKIDAVYLRRGLQRWTESPAEPRPRHKTPQRRLRSCHRMRAPELSV